MKPAERLEAEQQRLMEVTSRALLMADQAAELKAAQQRQLGRVELARELAAPEKS